MTEQQERAAKALRRAWREFTDKVNAMGNVTLDVATVKECEVPGVEFQFWAVARVDE